MDWTSNILHWYKLTNDSADYLYTYISTRLSASKLIYIYKFLEQLFGGFIVIIYRLPHFYQLLHVIRYIFI